MIARWTARHTMVWRTYPRRKGSCNVLSAVSPRSYSRTPRLRVSYNIWTVLAKRYPILRKPWLLHHSQAAFSDSASGRTYPPTSLDANQDHATAEGGRVAVAGVDITVVVGSAPALGLKVLSGRGKVGN